MAAEVVCVCPFVVIPTLMVFLNMGVTGYGGKINFFLDFSLLFLVISLPLLSFRLTEHKLEEYASLMKRREQTGVGKFDRQWRKLVKFNKAQNRDGLWFFV